MASPHVMVLPFPAQGHVIPLMELSHCLVEHGFEVTFVNTDLNHALVLEALAQGGETLEGIHMASIPDGLVHGEDRKDLNRLIEAFSKVMPGHLEELIRNINASGDKKIKWMIADVSMGWSLGLAKKLGLRAAAFCPSSAALFVIRTRIPDLIKEGVLDEKGLPKRHGTFQLSPRMPPIDTSEFSWNRASDPKGQQIIFQLVVRNNEATDLAEIIICNSFHEIESEAFALFPKILPVGPLFTDQQFKKPVGHFWNGDMSCMSWLDGQPANSVIYAAFGSFTIFNQVQLQELAEGLALASRPFLWVVRPDSTSKLRTEWLDELRRRVAPRGRIVSWCPQQQVLAHPSIACFISHCGWNSTMEGVRNGIPFLCWPYFTDQFLNQSYICNVWKTGLKMIPANDSGGAIEREQIKNKIEELLKDSEIKTRALMWMDIARQAISEGGLSYQNFRQFLDIVVS